VDDKRKVELDKFLKKTNKEFTTNVMMLGDTPPIDDSMIIKTDIHGLNEAIGVGGIPRGCIIEIYGGEGAGKTTVALHIIAKAQELGGVCHFEDAEHALNLSLAELIGVNIKELSFHQPDYGEQAMHIIKNMVESELFDVIVVDSVAALTPKILLGKKLDDGSQRAALANMMSELIPILATSARKSRTSVIFINQVREKPGVMYGSPEYTTGGRALKFYASLRIEARRGEPIKEGKLQVGHNLKVKVVKNKYAPPFKAASIPLHYYKGLDSRVGIIEMAIAWGVIDQASSMYYFKTEKWDKKWQGKALMFAEINNDKALFEDIHDMLNEVVSEAKKDGTFIASEDSTGSEE
jgi:recombination protein RecA